MPFDAAAVERLFDPSRDPDARVRDDDWFTPQGSPAAELYKHDTVGARRRWFEALRQMGRV